MKLALKSQKPVTQHDLYLGYTLYREKVDPAEILTFTPKGIWRRRQDVPEALAVQRIGSPVAEGRVWLVYYTYSHGDSFGYTDGDWDILGLHLDRASAETSARESIEPLKQRYNGYFGKLEEIRIYETAVKSGIDPDSISVVYKC